MPIGALAAIFGTSLAVSLSGALSPGPLTTLAVREGVRWGFWAGPALALGHGLIELLLVIGLALGLNQLLDNEAVTASIALAGGAFLLWLGLRILVTAPRQELRAERESGSGENGPDRTDSRGRGLPGAAPALAGAGAVVSVSNPFWVAWWATVGSAYVVKSLDEGVAGVASFYSGHVLADIAWLSLIASVLAGGRRLLSRRGYQAILGACGVFLLAMGGWFLSSGLGYVV